MNVQWLPFFFRLSQQAVSVLDQHGSYFDQRQRSRFFRLCSQGGLGIAK
jgi:hypothetical protein